MNKTDGISKSEKNGQKTILELSSLHYLLTYLFNRKSLKDKIQPTFSNSSVLRYFSFTSLYFAQGVPQGISFYALPTWLATHGYSPTDLAKYAAVVTLPWSFKIIAAPLMERISYLPMGRRRAWMMFGQVGIVVALFLMSTISKPEESISALMAFGFAISLFSIFQDIAMDGLAIDTLPADEQARANGLMWGAKVIGIAASVVLTSILLDSWGFSKAVLLFSSVILIVMIVPIIIKERSGEKRFPWSKGVTSPEVLNIQVKNWKALFKDIGKVIILPSSLLFIVVAFSTGIGKGLLDATLPVMTVQKLGWADEDYTKLFAMTTIVSGLIGMSLGGFLIDKLGKIKMIAILVLTVIPLIMGMSLLHDKWADPGVMPTFMFIFYIIDTFIIISIFALAMNLCWKPISATQFTLYMALYNLGISTGARIMGVLKEIFEWQNVILFYFVPMVILFTLTRFINIKKHVTKTESWEV